MGVHMANRLASVVTGVEDHPEAVGKVLLGRDSGDRRKDLASQGRICSTKLGHIGVMGLGDHHDMDGCLWRNIAKGEHGVGAQHLIRGDLTCDDAAKQAISYV
jgi:hypothetical protein